MKGIKGERHVFGVTSPEHKIFKGLGFEYSGTRTTNGYQKAPWWMYDTPKGEPVDTEILIAALIAAGFKHREPSEWDKEALALQTAGKPWYPEIHNHSKAFETRTWNFQRGGDGKRVLETIYVTSRHYHKRGDKLDFSHLGQMYYPG